MPDFDYPRELRLLTSGDFQRVSDGVTIKLPRQNILRLPRPNQVDRRRIGFIVSQKNVRRAVQRNRVRRIIRESFRLQQHKLPPVDIIIMARKGLDELSSDELHRLTKKCWSRLSKKAKQAVKK